MIYNYNIRPYIVINGISSQLIKGLIITKLPPITRAAQRTLTEEISGRDGDLVTPLGFSSYDKAIEIGLAGAYDVDDIITYFSTSGRVVFSNESDKYYKFACYDAINFNKLVRYKKATVNLHCQPFKYSENEGLRVFDEIGAGVLIRNSGNYYSRPTIYITGAGDVSLKINGESVLELSLAPQGQTIIIDCEEMEAYNENRTILLNRLVSGNYDNVRLKSGDNIISFSGAGVVTKLQIENFSRWL